MKQKKEKTIKCPKCGCIFGMNEYDNQLKQELIKQAEESWKK